MKLERPALTLAVALSFAPAAWAHDYKLGDLTIDHPWARASVAANGAAYMIISNSGTAPDKVVAAASPVAGKVELHTHIVEGDVMRMAQSRRSRSTSASPPCSSRVACT